MKAISPIKSLISLSLLFSIFLSACSSGGNESAANNSYSKIDQSLPAPYEMTAANSNSATAMKSPAGLYGDEEGTGGERYAQINENPFLETTHAPLSTFSIDVDTRRLQQRPTLYQRRAIAAERRRPH